METKEEEGPKTEEVKKQEEVEDDEGEEEKDEQRPLLLTEQLKSDPDPLDIGSKRSVTDNQSKK